MLAFVPFKYKDSNIISIYYELSKIKFLKVMLPNVQFHK